MDQKQNIRRVSQETLSEFLTRHGEKPFRAKQLMQWIWQKNAGSFEAMSNLPAGMRKHLSQAFYFYRPEILQVKQSSDGTRKFLFRFESGDTAEAVLIPSRERLTACISVQTGCAMGCAFCATAAIPRCRNLFPDEMIDQVVEIRRYAEENLQATLSNIVYMGMGEPLNNYDNVVQSLRILTREEGGGISYKRITLSTVGVPGMIEKLAQDNLKVNLAISLHAANNEKRSQIIPANRKYPVNKLREAITEYYNKTGSRITIEYILFKGVNDSLQDASELASFCRHFPVKVNIIEFNPVKNSRLEPSEPHQVGQFVEFLREKINIIVNVRKSRGRDIEAACGQLAHKQSRK